MSHPRPPYQRRSRRSSLLIRCCLLLVGALISLGVATPSIGNYSVSAIGTVDVVPPEFRLGQELYLENCATCHIPIPPSVLPRQTWQQILQDSQHYGTQIEPLIDPPRLLVWNYLRNFSRSMSVAEEGIPFRIERSRFFRALHPRVEFTEPISIHNCQTCHPGASNYNFRLLTPEWQDSP